MQYPRLRTVYRQRKWSLFVPVRKIITLGHKIIALGCKMFYYSVKCFAHGLRAFNGALQCRLMTQKVELRRIFDVCKR